MEIGTRLSDQVASYLDLAAAEVRVTAANMANIDTPGYRAVGIDFEGEMQAAMDAVDQGSSPRSPRLKATDGLVSRPDGNNVSMDRESLNLAEAQLKFKIGVSLLRQENQMVTDAIHSADK